MNRKRRLREDYLLDQIRVCQDPTLTMHSRAVMLHDLKHRFIAELKTVERQENKEDEEEAPEGRIAHLGFLRDKAEARRDRYRAAGKRAEARIEEQYIASLDREMARVEEAG